MNESTSKIAYAEAKKYIPGGVDSPVRAFKGIGRPPLFIQKASGPWLFDVDGNRYADYCLSWGVHLLGHNHPGVTAAARRTLSNGTSFGAPSVLETELAKRIVRAVPSVEKVRFVNSGTEAVMSAVRLARAFTKRDRIVKFDGCYHGHADYLLTAAGSGVSQLKRSTSQGIPQSFINETVGVPFNDTKAVERVFRQNRGKIAAVIVEPVPANMGVVLPQEGFLESLRDITARHGALLIFDEVITGFRLSLGGAQACFGIRPDLTTLGKIIGGGFPAGAFGGRKEIMDLLAPGGPVYQAGTLSGNPVAMAAGIAVLDEVSSNGFYEKLNAAAREFSQELVALAEKKKVTVNAIGAMFSVFFSEKPVTSYAGLKGCDAKRFARFYRKMLGAGIYLSPGQGESNFLSIQHSSNLLRSSLAILEKSL